MYKNVTGQGLYLYASVFASGAQKTGDAANITGQISKDGGAGAATFTANPTEIGHGVYWQPLQQAETNADIVSVAWTSTTAGVVIQPVFTSTLPGFNTGVMAQLADGVAHGGAPGSSTATLALDHAELHTAGGNPALRMTNTNGACVFLSGTGNGAIGNPTLAIEQHGTSGGIGILMQGGAAMKPGIGITSTVANTVFDAIGLAAIGGIGLKCTGDGGGASFFANTAGSNGVAIESGGGIAAGLFIEGGDSGPAIALLGPFTTPGPTVIVDATLADSGLDGGPGILVRAGAGDAIQLTPGGAGKYGLNTTVPPAFLDTILTETGLNIRQANSLQTAALAGVLAGAATTTVTIKGAGVATTRISATVDSSGNRSAITLTPPP